MKHICGIF
ncbi:unnamed protein product [Callosobruchus maculatus]|uniref:Uncharacterized protein n=1 Tax=Callosobruchus maculatus TaxID=64391 RepID=A0A653D7C9_CALMS|nr:unnamed protein product [Callosobruchus maculatus]